MLEPNFGAMPQALIDIPRWVVWKGAKVPYCASAVNSKASVNDPSTWTAFGQAQTAFEEGGYSGVGFVLSGDGVVGVDLDGCVSGGEPEEAALCMFDRIGCEYIEFSPSNTGLRGFGYGSQIVGTKGQLDGVHVELYTSRRYLTVTGHPIRRGPLVELAGFSEVAAAIRETSLQRSTEDPQKMTEDDFRNPLCSSVEFPVNTIPVAPGQRNACLFALARHLKGSLPDATRPRLREIVATWHQRNLSVIGTEDLAVTLTDFFRGWAKVRHPEGETMSTILNAIDYASPLPARILALGYGPAGNQLVRICAALQVHHRDQPFFISVRKAGELLGVNFTYAAKMLAALVSDGVLKLIVNATAKSASRYRFEEASWRV